MTLVVLLLTYFIFLLLEVSAFPVFGAARFPAISTAFLVMGIAWLDFYPAFWFAGLAGLGADFFVSPAPWAAHTIIALSVFLVVSFFRAVIQLDRPLYTIASLAVGFLSLPLSWLSAFLINEIFFRRTSLSFLDFFSFDRLFLVQAAYAALFVIVFSWFFIRRFSKERDVRLG